MVLSQNYAKLAVLPHNILLEDKKTISASFTKRPPFLCLSYYPLGALYIFQKTKMLLLQGMKEELISPFAIHHSMLQFSEISRSRAVIPGTTPHPSHLLLLPALITLELTPIDRVQAFFTSRVQMFSIFPHNKFLYLLKYLNILDN